MALSYVPLVVFRVGNPGYLCGEIGTRAPEAHVLLQNLFAQLHHIALNCYSINKSGKPNRLEVQRPVVMQCNPSQVSEGDCCCGKEISNIAGEEMFPSMLV